jgi:outer membrane lipoprotein SlyB
MKINNNLFKGDKNGAAKGMMLGAAAGGVIGAVAGHGTGSVLGKEVAKKTSLEKDGMRIKVEDDLKTISVERLFDAPIWDKKGNVIYTVGDDIRSTEPCTPSTLENCYIYTHTPEEFFGDPDYKKYLEKFSIQTENEKRIIKNYSMKGMLVGALAGTFIGSVVGGFIGALVGSDEGKKG